MKCKIVSKKSIPVNYHLSEVKQMQTVESVYTDLNFEYSNLHDGLQVVGYAVKPISVLL